MMNTQNQRSVHGTIRLRVAASGFTLIEVLVAMVIGIISMVVVLQTFSASESTKRTTTGGDDAQVAGAMGLFNLERDMAQAGYGVTATPIIGCTVTMPAAGGSKVIPLAPVTINPPTSLIPAGDANTDTLLIVYGNTNGVTDGDVVQGVVGKAYTMQGGVGWTAADYVAGVQYTGAHPTSAAPSPCGGSGLDKIASTTTTTVNVTNGGLPSSTNSNYVLYDLGPSPSVVGYRVYNAALTSCNYVTTNCSSAANWSEVQPNIVSMRAVYGHDTASPKMSGIVSTWDQATPTPAPSTCSWLRIPAVAIALVARNGTAVNSNASNSANGTVAAGSFVTTASPRWQEPVWSTSVLTWNSAVATYIDIDLSGTNANLPSGMTWQNYRYRLYSTVVPLHNVTWAVGGQAADQC